MPCGRPLSTSRTTVSIVSARPRRQFGSASICAWHRTRHWRAGQRPRPEAGRAPPHGGGCASGSASWDDSAVSARPAGAHPQQWSWFWTRTWSRTTSTITAQATDFVAPARPKPQAGATSDGADLDCGRDDPRELRRRCTSPARANRAVHRFEAFSQDREQRAIAADQVFAKPTFRSKGSCRSVVRYQTAGTRSSRPGSVAGRGGQLVSPPEQTGRERVAAS